MQGGDHGGTGRQAIIHHNDHSTSRIDRGPDGGVLRTPLAQRIHLGLLLLLNVVFSGAIGGGEPGNIGPATLVNRADGQFRLMRGTQFAHQDNIQLTTQLVRDDFRHRNRSAGNGENQRILVSIGSQFLDQAVGCIGAITKHVFFPFMERVSETKTPTLVGRIEGMPKAALTYRKLAFADTGKRVFCELSKQEPSLTFTLKPCRWFGRIGGSIFFGESGCAME